MRRALSLILSLSLVAQSFAADVVINGNVNGRSSANFYGRKNIEAVLSKGTEGDLVEPPLILPSGNSAVHMKITKLGAGTTNLQIGDSVWVYYHKDPRRRFVELMNADHNPAQVALQAKTAEVKKPFRIDTPEPESHKREARASQNKPCVSCGENHVANPPMDTGQQTKTVEALVAAENKQTELNEEEELKDIPKVNPAAEEFVANFIDKYAEKDSNPEYNTHEGHLKLANYFIQYCKAYGVDLKYALPLALHESHFRASVTNQGDKEGKTHAFGIMQLMPGTELMLAKKLNLIPQEAKTVPPEIHNNPEKNIQMGIYYFKTCLNRFHNDPKKAYAGYNLGEGGAALALAGKPIVDKQNRPIKHTSGWRGFVRDCMKWSSVYQTASEKTGWFVS
jgi:hypothetical protein